MIKPLGKNILVKKKPKEDKPGSLILPNIVDTPFEANVIDFGSKVDIEINKGETLLLVPYSGSRISMDDESYLLISEKDILGIVV